MLENARWKFCWQQQRQLLIFPSAGKAFKPISGSYAWKTACCLQFQVYHAVKKSVAWEPLRYTCSSLCSSSQRVYQPPQAHDQGSIMSCHRLVPTGRSGDHPPGLPGVLLPHLLAPRNHQVCPKHFNQCTNCTTSSGPECSVLYVIQKGMG